MDFTALKMIHVATAAVSYALFFVRGIWMIDGSPCLGERWARIVPHADRGLAWEPGGVFLYRRGCADA